MKTKFLTLLLLLAFFAGCSKNETLELNEPENQELDATTLQENLNLLSVGILGVSENETVKQIVYTEIEKKFDGEYNVLFKTVLDECNKNNIDLMQLMQNYLDSKGYKANITETIQGFTYVDGVNYYPQIYIPFYSNDGRNSSLKTASSIKIVTDDIVEAKIPKTEFVGMQLSNNKSTIDNISVNETYALNNPVWVVSLNERVNNDGVYIPQEVLTTNKAAKYTELKAYNVPNVSAVEGWTRGGPEFTVRFIPLSGQIVSVQNFESTRAQVNGNNWKTVNRYILHWDAVILNKYLIAHWLERDGGTTKVLDLSFSYKGFKVTLPINVGSKDDDCGYQGMYYDELSGPIFGTGWVNWDMK